MFDIKKYFEESSKTISKHKVQAIKLINQSTTE